MPIIAAPANLAAGLIECMDAAGILQSHSPDGWHVSDATAANAFIAAYSGSAAELNWHKAQALAALAAQYETVIAEGRLYTVTGGADATQHTYQIDEVAPINPATGQPTRRNSQGTITSLGAWASQVVAGMPGVQPWPTDFGFTDAANVPVPMTAAQLYAFSQDVAGYVAAIDLNFFTLRLGISAQTTVAGVTAINTGAGWPVNP